MSRVTNQNKQNDDLSILSKHSILPEYSKQSEQNQGIKKSEYIFKQPPRISPIQYATQMPTDYNPFHSDENANYFHGLINVDSEGSQHFGNEGSTTENTHILTQPVKGLSQSKNHLRVNLNQTNGQQHTQSKETFMPMRSPDNDNVGNGLQTPSLMEQDSPQNPNETMDNFKTQPIIDVEEEPKYRDFGLKTIQDFRRETPKVRKMNDLVHQDQQRLQPLMRTTFGSSMETPLNKKEILDKAKYQSDFVEQSFSSQIDKAFNKMKQDLQPEQVESNTRNEALPATRTTPTDSNIAQWKGQPYFTMEQDVQAKQRDFKYQSQAEYNESIQQIEGDETHEKELLRLGNRDSPAKLKLRALSNVKMRLPNLNQGYHYQLDYVKNASMFSLNQGGNRRTQSSLAAPFYNDVGGYKDIKSKYPNLMNELNDSSSPIPAYQRFQRPNSRLLREDLREDKIKHFAKNYKTELQKPKAFLTQFEKNNDKIQEQREKLAAEDYHEDDIFKMQVKNKEVDTTELRSTMNEQLQLSKQSGQTLGSEYFEMKYFVNDEQLKGNMDKSKKKPLLDKIMKKFQQAPTQHKHDLSWKEAQAAVKEQYLVQEALGESRTIPSTDHAQNFQDVRKTIDKQYQNGQFLIEDLKHKRFASQGSEYAQQLELERSKSTNMSPKRNVLAETKRKFLEDAARAKLYAKKSQFAFKENIGKQNFTFNTQNIDDLSQIRKAPSALSKVYNEAKYFKDEGQNFLTEGKDYRDYMRNTIKDFNRTITDRSEAFNIQLPLKMRLKLNLKNEGSQNSDENYMMAQSDRKPKPRPKKISYRELMNTRKVATKPPPMVQQRNTVMRTSPLKGLYQKNLQSSSSSKMVDENGRKITSNTKVFKGQGELLKNEFLMSSYRKTMSNFNLEHSYDEYVPAHFGPPMQGISTLKGGRISGSNSKQSSTIDLKSLKPSQRMSLKQILHVEEGINQVKKHIKQHREFSDTENTY